MKNINAWGRAWFALFPWFDLKMKISLLLFFVTLFQLQAGNGYAQKTKFSLNMEAVTVLEVMEHIEKISDFHFQYFKEDVKVTRKVSIKVKKKPIQSVLQVLFKDSDIAYEVDDKYIILSKKKVSPELKNKRNSTSPNSMQLRVNGTVTGAPDGTPLPGITVVVKGTSQGTISDFDGKYSIDVQATDILIFSYVGYKSIEIPVDGQTTIDVQMEVSVSNLDEVVLVGYGSQKRKDVVGSIARIDADDIELNPTSNPFEGLQGLIPGLEITSNSGDPGSDVSVRLRGINSTNSVEPLVLVDNVPTDIGAVIPADIESIDILKDAAATAIYGARGSHGVILITTKKGKEGKGKLSVNMLTTINTPSQFNDVLNTEEYITLREEAFTNDNISITDSNAPDLLLDPSVNTNWRDAVYSPSFTREVNVNFSGGSSRVNYFLSGNYRDEDAMITGNWYAKRYNLRANVSGDLNERTTIGINMSFRNNNNRTYSSGVPTSAYYALPMIPEFDEEGNKNLDAYYPYINPNRLLTAYNESSGNQFLSNIFIDYNITPSLLFHTDLNLESANSKTKSFFPTTSSSLESDMNSGAYGFDDNRQISIEPRLTYDTQFGKNQIKLMMGGTYLNSRYESTTISTYTTSNAIDDLNSILNGNVSNRTFNMAEYKFNSIFGRATYKYNNRYLLEGVLRRDGSSRFSPDFRYGNFWSVAGSWVLSEEPFIKNIIGEESFLKFRTSYGTTGTDAIGDYGYLSRSTVPSSNYMENSTLYVSGIPNATLKWEETKKFNLGIDFSTWNSRFNFALDVYRATTSDMLFNQGLSNVTGFGRIIKNLPGKIENKGIELVVEVKPIKNERTLWNSRFAFTKLWNKLVSLPGLENADIFYRYQFREGEPLDLIWGYNYLGVNPDTGIATFEDVDKNGIYSINTDDWQVIGKSIPDYYGSWTNSIRVADFDFSIVTQFVYDIDKQYGIVSVPGNNYNLPRAMLNRWQNVGDQRNIPRAAVPGTDAYNINSNIIRSSFAYDDASYIRVKNITLGYNLPTDKNKFFDQLRFYATGYNLWTLTGFKGADPETGDFVVPNKKTYTVGVNMTLK